MGKSEEILPKYYKDYEEQHGGEKAHADVIVVDPPRKGCDAKLLDTILKMQPERIVYVSCDSATLARDLKILCEGAQEDEKTAGYQIEKWRAVDQFPMTTHVETVCLLSREKVDGYVNVDLDANKIVSKSKTGTATYKEIKEYINDKYGFTVSSLNIAQIKDKCGLDKRKNYNKGAEGHKVPACPEKKEKAILDAFEHFGLV